MSETNKEEMNGLEGLRQRIEELEEENERLRALSTLDEVTGLFLTQKLGREIILQEIEKNHQDEKTVGLIRMDVDDLKGWNTRLGHDSTDELLGKVGEKMRDWVSSRNGIAMRFHGDELGVLIPCEDENELVEATSSLGEITITDLTDEELIVGFSIGCAHEEEDHVQEEMDKLDFEEGKALEEAGRLFTALSKVADERERKQKKER